MLDYKITEDGFQLFYQEHVFLNHSRQNPCIKVGKGTGKFKMRFGDFKIREKDVVLTSLSEFSINQLNKKNLEIHFKYDEEQITLMCQVVKEKLEIIFSVKNENLNRLSIKINAEEDEAIYGCGEQYSELNLRGKDVPLWVEEQGVGRGDPPITGDWYTTYIPMPTFVSSENYFVHSESTSYAIFKFSDPNYHELLNSQVNL